MVQKTSKTVFYFFGGFQNYETKYLNWLGWKFESNVNMKIL